MMLAPAHSGSVVCGLSAREGGALPRLYVLYVAAVARWMRSPLLNPRGGLTLIP